MLRNMLVGAAATLVLLAGHAVAREVEDPAMDGARAADPVPCEDDGLRAEASQACTDAKAAIEPTLKPTIATEPATTGESARAAFDQPPVTTTDTANDVAREPTTEARRPEPFSTGPSERWPALLP